MNLLKVASYNVDIAKRMGLLTASLISYVSQKHCDAQRNQLINKNGTFSIKRSDISEDTGLSIDEQKSVESSLGKINALEVLPFKDELDRVYYRFNETALYEALGKTNAKPVSYELADSISSPSVRAKRITSSERSMNEAKRAIKEEDESLRQMWYDWIDAVYARRFTLTQAAVIISEKQLEKYDRVHKEEILHNAIKNGYRDISWSIKACNNEKKDTIPTNWKSYESMQPNCNTKISGESF